MDFSPSNFLFLDSKVLKGIANTFLEFLISKIHSIYALGTTYFIPTRLFYTFLMGPKE